jgi:hypothetical protein
MSKVKNSKEKKPQNLTWVDDLALPDLLDLNFELKELDDLFKDFDLTKSDLFNFQLIDLLFEHDQTQNS